MAKAAPAATRCVGYDNTLNPRPRFDIGHSTPKVLANCSGLERQPWERQNLTVQTPKALAS
jgi:hypothetical protein